MPSLTLDGWIALSATALVFAGLWLRRGMPVDLLFLGGLSAVTLLGVINPVEALSGFSNPAVITIGGLFVVAAGLRNTGVLDFVGHKLLGSAQDDRTALRRLALAIVPASAFMPNTPLVAMLVPVVMDWCRRRGVSPSRLLIPVSYLAILGGVCTLIGTTTTLVVNGMLLDARLPPMGLFDIGRVGLPCALIGTTVLVVFGRRLLPERQELVEQLGEHRREYLLEMLVRPECRLIGQTVEAAGLRRLQGLFLIEINRLGEIISPVTPNDIIRAGDRLVFTGVVTSIRDLEKIPGLVPAADMAYQFHPTTRQQRHLTEAVLSRTSPLIGTNVRRANFRQRYGAAVVAVHRGGVRLTNKIGEILLQPGDTLLLQTRTDFVKTFRHSRDFYLVSSVEGSEAIRHDRALLCSALMIVLVVWLCLAGWFGSGFPGLGGFTSTAFAAVTIAGLVIVTRCLPVAQARGALDLQVLLTIASALGLGKSLTTSGAADAIANSLVGAIGDHPHLLLAMLYLLAMIFTELITNVAVAAMLFPIAVALSQSSGYRHEPFVMAVALAASLSFITPVGYQTNLMVMGPGGYRPTDYLRAGWPLAISVMVTALILIPIMWPF